MNSTSFGVVFAGVLLLASGALTAVIIVALKPLLDRYATARPNARSSHKNPTPQGAGIAIVFVILALTACAAAWTGSGDGAVVKILLGVAVLAVVGAVDDVRGVGVLPRLLVQIGATAVMISALPPNLQLAPLLPLWIERLLLGLIALWIINLVNFMDGLDWMTVAEVIPVAGALAVFGLLEIVSLPATIVALVLVGAMLGFAPFNKPVARLFLGDVGSLPIGLLLGWLLIVLAGSGHVAAAILLPLYYVADATITLVCRLVRGEAVWQAHREHFYQRAFDRGLPAPSIVTRVFSTNVALALLAAATIIAPGMTAASIALIVGAAIVGSLLLSFSRAR